MKKDQALMIKAKKILKTESPDLMQAYELLSKALDLGNAEAIYAIGTWYLHGRFLKKNIAKGMTLIKKAAYANYPDALFDLATSYEQGRGVKQDLKSAFRLYVKAMLYGEKQSVYEIGRCYYYGIGILKNKELAWVWLDRANELGIEKNKQ